MGEIPRFDETPMRVRSKKEQQLSESDVQRARTRGGGWKKVIFSDTVPRKLLNGEYQFAAHIETRDGTTFFFEWRIELAVVGMGNTRAEGFHPAALSQLTSELGPKAGVPDPSFLTATHRLSFFMTYDPRHDE